VRARRIKLMAFDVDGVLTDGSLFYTDQGIEIKAFNTLDGQGLKMLQQAGITVAIITGRRPAASSCERRTWVSAPLSGGRQQARGA
jgi:3-deoxy-D-manno-octulosonate 8-phosphate phosphatase (KDO 8-P phosphatase)